MGGESHDYGNTLKYKPVIVSKFSIHLSLLESLNKHLPTQQMKKQRPEVFEN